MYEVQILHPDTQKPVEEKPVNTANEQVNPSDTSVQKITPTPYKPPMSWYGVHDTLDLLHFMTEE